MGHFPVRSCNGTVTSLAAKGHSALHFDTENSCVPCTVYQILVHKVEVKKLSRRIYQQITHWRPTYIRIWTKTCDILIALPFVRRRNARAGLGNARS